MAMSKGRLEAFSDGVIAIIITIMVLELKAPEHAATFADLRPLIPVFVSYALSFLYVAIFWVNHHHLIQAAGGVSGAILWANLHFLFWLSLVPFVTAWMGENHFGPAPTALYGATLFLAGMAYMALQRTIVRAQGRETVIAKAVGADFKGKVSLVLYAIAIPASFFSRWVAGTIYALVALLWLVPDPRIERAFASERASRGGGT
jgi:uncharacterized membrane protein